MNETEKQGVYQIGGSLVDDSGLKIYNETVEALLGIADKAFDENTAGKYIDDKAREAYTEEAIEEIDFIAVSAVHQLIKLVKKFSQKQVI